MEREQTRGGKLIERPIPFSFQVEKSGAKVMAPRDQCRFAEVKVRFVCALEMRTTKVGNVTTGEEVGMAGIPFQRVDIRRVGSPE